MSMDEWLYRSYRELGSTQSVLMWVGIATLAVLALLLLAKAIQALTGVSLFSFDSHGNRPGKRTGSDDIPGGNEKILIVDDEPSVRETLARLLEELGYRVVSVTSGEDALNYMESNGADLILLDLHMEPGLDGVETFRRIRRFRPLQKAIVVTGQADPAEISAVRALGVAHYLIKPAPVSLLARVIREELSRP